MRKAIKWVKRIKNISTLCKIFLCKLCVTYNKRFRDIQFKGVKRPKMTVNKSTTAVARNLKQNHFCKVFGVATIFFVFHLNIVIFNFECLCMSWIKILVENSHHWTNEGFVDSRNECVKVGYFRNAIVNMVLLRLARICGA